MPTTDPSIEFIYDLLRLRETSITKTAHKDTTTPATPDEEFTITHSLGTIPNGYIVIKQDKAATVYDGTTAWTTDLIYLKCDTATVAVRVLIF